MTAFVPNIVGAVVPTNWAVMWIIAPVLLFKTKIELTLIHVLGSIFLLYASLSWMWSPHGTLDLLRLFGLASVFVWATTLKDLKNIVFGLSCGLCVVALIAISQYFGFDIVFKATDKPAGLFVNSNVYSEITGMLFLLILIYKLWWFLPATIPGLLVSSRATIIGLGLTFLIWLWAKSRSLAIFISILTTLAFVLTTNFEDFKSVYERFDIWKDTISGFTLLGHGVGSFVYDYPIYEHYHDMMTTRPFEAHNDLLQLIFEFGIGIIPLILMISLLLKTNDNHKYPLIFFIIISQLGFPFHMPVTAFMATILAAYLVNHSLDYSYISDNIRSILFTRRQAQGYREI